MKSLLSSRFRGCVFVAIIINICLFTRVKYRAALHSWMPGDRNRIVSNATLGFEKILVVAPNNVPEPLKWRKDGLLKAAGHNGLSLEIPPQPVWSAEDTRRLMAKNKELKKGYALSWLGHLHVLSIAARSTTSLVLEDDVDWDVEIHTQMPMIAEAVRNLTNYQPEMSNGSTESITSPYGTGWDILWLGHCGDSIVFDPPPIMLNDPSVPPFINSWEKTISPNPQQQRFIHWSAGPICTYAYAISGITAKALLERSDHGAHPYDIWLHILCKGRKLRCITINPELFHHHEGAGIKHTITNGLTPEAGSNEKEFTDNIWHSARCNSASKSSELVTCMGKKQD